MLSSAESFSRSATSLVADDKGVQQLEVSIFLVTFYILQILLLLLFIISIQAIFRHT